jgi:hypothetical protein
MKKYCGCEKKNTSGRHFDVFTSGYGEEVSGTPAICTSIYVCLYACTYERMCASLAPERWTEFIYIPVFTRHRSENVAPLPHTCSWSSV